MKADKLIDAIGSAREEYILDAETSGGRKKRVWPALAAAAACLAVVVGTLASTGVLRGPGDYELSARSENVRVFNLSKPPKVRAENSLLPLTEEEIFTRWNTVIFRGTVTDIRNIEVDMNGESFYWSVVSVEVTKVFRGDLKPGDTAVIRTDASIDTAAWVEDYSVLEKVSVGTEGIFMPQVYDGDSMFGANGAYLCLQDIAPYGFADGQRFAFLRTDEGLVFDRDYAYERIAGVQTLEEIEAYIGEMLAKTALTTE